MQTLALGKGRMVVRIVMGALIVTAVGAGAWIISLPNMAECRASGRVVDPTERHCLSDATTYQQLQEHATLHAVPVVILALIVLAVAYMVHRINLARAARSRARRSEISQ